MSCPDERLIDAKGRWATYGQAGTKAGLKATRLPVPVWKTCEKFGLCSEKHSRENKSTNSLLYNHDKHCNYSIPCLEVLVCSRNGKRHLSRTEHTVLVTMAGMNLYLQAIITRLKTEVPVQQSALNYLTSHKTLFNLQSDFFIKKSIIHSSGKTISCANCRIFRQRTACLMAHNILWRVSWRNSCPTVQKLWRFPSFGVLS